MDEYTMVWSDALRAEAAAHGPGRLPPSSADGAEFGTLGKALWAERCLARVLALGPDVNANAARALVCNLGTSRSWLQVEPEKVASMILQSQRCSPEWRDEERPGFTASAGTVWRE